MDVPERPHPDREDHSKSVQKARWTPSDSGRGGSKHVIEIVLECVVQISGVRGATLRADEQVATRHGTYKRTTGKAQQQQQPSTAADPQREHNIFSFLAV